MTSFLKMSLLLIAFCCLLSFRPTRHLGDGWIDVTFIVLDSSDSLLIKDAVLEIYCPRNTLYDRFPANSVNHFVPELPLGFIYYLHFKSEHYQPQVIKIDSQNVPADDAIFDHKINMNIYLEKITNNEIINQSQGPRYCAYFDEKSNSFIVRESKE